MGLRKLQLTSAGFSPTSPDDQARASSPSERLNGGHQRGRVGLFHDDLAAAIHVGIGEAVLAFGEQDPGAVVVERSPTTISTLLPYPHRITIWPPSGDSAFGPGVKYSRVPRSRRLVVLPGRSIDAISYWLATRCPES